jgi:regulator of protease activity HflC (stomatin/prohibitin superfamily)
LTLFRFGRLVAQKGPGLVFLVPIADRMVRVTLRTITHTIPPQDVITRDNVPARVDAVAYFRVVDADASVVDIENYLQATSEIAKTTLRSVLGKAELDTLLSERERLNEDLQRIIDEQTEPWASRWSRSRSRTSASRRRCSARWPARRKPSGTGVRR